MTDALGKAAMAEDSRSRLGRGLAALIGDVATETSVERPRGQRRLPTGSLRPNARNPRRAFSNAELDDLVASLRERGIIQPIIARAVRGAADAYEIIAGERRWRAAQRAGLHDVPVVIIEATDAEALQLAIIENVQRTDLNPLEEADGYRALMEEFGNSQDDIAKIIGKSRSHVANTLRLLKLPEPVKAYIHAGKLSAGHARMLVGQPNAEELAEEIVARGLNVRQVEAIAREAAARTRRAARPGRRSRATGGKKRQSGRARKAHIRRAWLGGQYRSSRARRGAQHPLSQPRSTRRGAAAAGEEALILLSVIFRKPVSILGSGPRTGRFGIMLVRGLPRRLESLALGRVVEARIIVGKRLCRLDMQRGENRPVLFEHMRHLLGEYAEIGEIVNRGIAGRARDAGEIDFRAGDRMAAIGFVGSVVRDQSGPSSSARPRQSSSGCRDSSTASRRPG